LSGSSHVFANCRTASGSSAASLAVSSIGLG
jgi:hypothetical protein